MVTLGRKRYNNSFIISGSLCPSFNRLHISSLSFFYAYYHWLSNAWLNASNLSPLASSWHCRTMEENLGKDEVPYPGNTASPLRPVEQNAHQYDSTGPRVMPSPNSPTRYRSNSKTALDERSTFSGEAYMHERRTGSPRREVDELFRPENHHAGEDMASEELPPYTTKSFYRTRASRPLIDLVKNEWRTNPKYGQAKSPSPDRSNQSRWARAMAACRFQRHLLVYLLLVGACWLSWKCYLEPQWEEHLLLSGSLDERVKTGKGWFGSNRGLVFTDMVQLKMLDRRLVPGVGSERTRKRLVIMGDVHGCKQECKFPVTMKYILRIVYSAWLTQGTSVLAPR